MNNKTMAIAVVVVVLAALLVTYALTQDDEDDNGFTSGPPTVVYDGNGGTYNGSSTIKMVSYDAFTNPFTYDGHKFIGWNTARDGSGTMYQPWDELHFTKTTTLYAQWVAYDGHQITAYINTSSFFTPYINGAEIDVFAIPIDIKTQGNSLEIRPNSSVTSVSDAGNGDFAFTLSEEPGVEYIMTLELRGCSNVSVQVGADGIISITFDADEDVAVLINDNILSSEDIQEFYFSGYGISGLGFKSYLNDKALDSIPVPSYIQQYDNVVRLVPNSNVTDVKQMDDSILSFTFNAKGHGAQTLDVEIGAWVEIKSVTVGSDGVITITFDATADGVYVIVTSSLW